MTPLEEHVHVEARKDGERSVSRLRPADHQTISVPYSSSIIGWMTRAVLTFDALGVTSYAQDASLEIGRDIPAAAVPQHHAFVIANGGESHLFNVSAGIVKAPF